MAIKRGSGSPKFHRDAAVPVTAVPFPVSEPEPSSSTSGFKPSPQQEAVFSWVEEGSGSAFIEAVAGSGKTTTLIQACQRMQGSVAFAAFNKKIADEIKLKTAGMSNIRVGTFHSFGFAAWRRVAPGAQVEADQKRKRMLQTLDVPGGLWSAVAQLVSLAKQSVVGKLWRETDSGIWLEMIDHYDVLLKVEDEELGTGMSLERALATIINYAIDGVRWSRDIGTILIDFDDMIWLPLVEDAPVYENDWVLVDEAQDTNPARRLLARRMLKRGGRSVWVGDRNQAIYGFTGADDDAVDTIIRDFHAIELPLTVTYRCSKAATRLAQSWVPRITAHEKNVEGAVLEMSADGFLQQAGTMTPGDAILCRNTRPLVELAFRLIRLGVPCHVEGRDIGKQLESLAGKWKVSSCAALVTNLESYRQREIDKYIAKDAPYAIEALNDRIDTLMVIMEGCATVEEVRLKIDRMFKDTNGGKAQTVILSTIHKAKGREWSRVFILGWGKYCPSRWAQQAWQMQQETNLLYVACTRTKDNLVLTAALEE